MEITKILNFELKNFTRRRCLNGVARQGKRKDRDSYPYCLDIYPNGNKPENADYISIVFGLFDLDRQNEDYRKNGSDASSSCITMCIVDTNDNLRFSQSFGRDFKIEPHQAFFPLEIDRFVRRRVLLEASEELLPGDRLKVRCVVDDYFSVGDSLHILNAWKFTKNLLAVAKEESWYTVTEYGDRALNLRNPNSPLCSRLRKKSGFFIALFRSHCKETEDGYMPIDELFDLDGMLGYIRFGNTKHLAHYNDFLSVYDKACLFGVRDLEEICIEYFKNNLTGENAIEILRIADSRGDADLRTLAFQKALANWEEWSWNGSEEWKNLRFEWPQLASELSCAARIINLEKAPALFNLAAGEVLRKKKKVQNSPMWSIFAKKLPDLAKVILEFDSYKFLQVEKCKDHTSDYDFYQ